jgi:hypothetical protein
MTDDDASTLSVLVPVDDSDRDRFDVRFRRRDVPVTALSDSLREFLGKMEETLSGVPSALSGFQINEITLSLEVSATGKVTMLGTGAEVTGTGGLTLTLTRRPEDAPKT